MDLEGEPHGKSVLVRLEYRDPQRQGAIGTIKKRYGTRDYRAGEVLFPDGQTELFWDHQLEETKEDFPRTKQRWVFW